MRLRTRYQLTGYCFTLPAVVFFLVIAIIPMCSTFWLSLYRWDLISDFKKFVGFRNYQLLLDDKIFLLSFMNTLRYTIGVVVPTLTIALGLAMLMETGVRFEAVFSTGIFLPVIISPVVAAFIWMLMYEPTYGIFNFILGKLGCSAHGFLKDPDEALQSIIVMSVWKQVGYYMVIFLAGLRNIPNTYYEAARIDGALGWQRFRYITIPLLKPVLLLGIVVAVINAFQVFTEVYVMTEGGPVNSTSTLVYLLYQTGFRNLRMGYASSMSVIIFASLLLWTVVQFRLMGKDVQY